VEQRAGWPARETFSFQKPPTSHPTCSPTFLFEGPRLVGTTKPQAMQTHNRTIVTKVAQQQHPFLLAFVMRPPFPCTRGLGETLKGQAEAGKTSTSLLHVSASSTLQPIHRETRALIGAPASHQQPSHRQHGLNSLPGTGLCLWLQTGCRKWGTREGWGCHRAAEGPQGALPQPGGPYSSPRNRESEKAGTQTHTAPTPCHAPRRQGREWGLSKVFQQAGGRG
jgi:hypothetical protein